MIRGTTVRFKFKLPYPKGELEWATIKFWQPNNPSPLLPIARDLSHCSAADDSYELCVSLNSEETTRFVDKYKAKVQLRAKHASSGVIFGCTPRLITVYPMNDEILNENPEMPSENAEGWVVLDGGAVAE